MPDARMPERYLNDRRIMKLNAEEFRAYVLTTIWCVSNRTDGYVLSEDIDHMWWMNNAKPIAFERRDLWRATEEGWVLLDFQSMQTSRAEFERLEDMRKAEREKKRRQRANKTGEATIHTPTFSGPGDIPGDVPGRVPEDRTGEDRQEGHDKEIAHDTTTGEVRESAEPMGEWAPSAPASEVIRDGNKVRRVRRTA